MNGDFYFRIDASTGAYDVRSDPDHSPPFAPRLARIQRASTGYPELARTLARSRWGLGYATESGRAVLHRLLAERGVRRATATADARNLGSLRVMEKLGMRPEAEESTVVRGKAVRQVTYGMQRSADQNPP